MRANSRLVKELREVWNGDATHHRHDRIVLFPDQESDLYVPWFEA